MSLLVADPELLITPRQGHASQLAEHWTRLVEWSLESNLKLTRATWESLSQHYAELQGDPDAWFHRAQAKAIHRAMMILISRNIIDRDDSAVDNGFSIPDRSPTGAHAYLVGELAGLTAPDRLASAPEFWPAAARGTTVSTTPNAYGVFLLEFTPHQPSKADQIQAQHNLCKDKKILIVGGQRDAAYMETIAREVGIRPSDVTWLPCEKTKPPRHLPKRIAGAAMSDTVVVCITGKVGHSTSGTAKDECASRGVEYIEAYTVDEIVPGILRALQDSTTDAPGMAP